MKTRLLVCLLCFLAPLAHAQNEEPGSEDVMVLSPFSVSTSSDEDYARYKPISSAGVNPQYVDGAPSSNAAAVSITKRAESVAIQFVLSNKGDKQELRNKELYASVEAVEKEITKIPGLRMEQREVKFTGGDRKFLSISKAGSTLSFVNVLILADLPVGLHVADRAKQVRDVLAGVKLSGVTKYSDGYIGLYLKNPDQYRREILQKIFDDIAIMKKGFDGEFEIRPTGLNQKVKVRAVSETDMELWIDYSFTFVSIRELQRPVTHLANETRSFRKE